MSQPITAAALLKGLASSGTQFVSGVPCSYFSGPLRLLESGDAFGIRYVPAVNEGAAVALAAGARLAGESAAVLVQNSGFGNMINPLTSLVLPYRIPLLVLMSMRGWPDAGQGEEQHFWMGRVAQDWLQSLDVPHWIFSASSEPFDELMTVVGEALHDRRPAFVLVAKGAIEGACGQASPATGHRGPNRRELVAALLAEVTDQHILSTTGYLSRELFNQGDRASNFYMQGSMGHVTSLALGAALARPDRRFVILDGDGAVLMHMGSLSTVGHCLPENLTHVVFDNSAYESTGAQRTAACRTDFPAVGRACGYRKAISVGLLPDLRPALAAALASAGPAIVVVNGTLDSASGGRASESLSPIEIANRFSASLGGRGRVRDRGRAGGPRRRGPRGSPSP